MRILITILFLSLSCESLIDLLGPFGFLVFELAALFFSCLAEKKSQKKRKAGWKMPSICVKNIYTILPKHTLFEIYSTADSSHIFDGPAAEIPPEFLFLEVVKLQTQGNTYILHVR